METTSPCRFLSFPAWWANSMNVALYRIYPLERHIHRLAGRGWRPIGHSGFTDHL